MKQAISILVWFCIGMLCYHPAQSAPIIKVSDGLEIEPITDHVWVHRSFLTNEYVDRFPCNGMIYLLGNECYLFDTPVTDSATTQLIQWLTDRSITIKGVVVHHFHVDCIQGLEIMHANGIPSYGNKRTVALAKKQGFATPQRLFNKVMMLQLQGQQIHLFYPGKAHTKDNIVSWLPAEGFLFGGCMVKAKGMGKGNLEDAYPKAWAQSIRNLHAHFPEINRVIPGHGDWGTVELLPYTIQLFTEMKETETQ